MHAASTSSSMRTRSSPAGFTLLEAMLALFIFSTAVVALVEAVNATGRTFHMARREGQIQDRLETLLVEATRDPLYEPGVRTAVSTEREVEEEGVSFLIRHEPLDFRSAEDVALGELYEVSVTARWMEEGQKQEATVQTWVYPPLFALPKTP